MKEQKDEDIILNQAVIDFYRKIESRPAPTQTVSLDIPVEYQDAVRELLAKLRGCDVQPTVLEPQRITSHPDIEYLLTVYNNQNHDEQLEGFTIGRNGIGFNKIDAPILTDLAEKYLSQGYLTAEELAIVSARIKKYHKQWS